MYLILVSDVHICLQAFDILVFRNIKPIKVLVKDNTKCSF